MSCSGQIRNISRRSSPLILEQQTIVLADGDREVRDFLNLTQAQGMREVAKSAGRPETGFVAGPARARPTKKAAAE